MRRAVLACLVAFGLVAAACSSDDDDSAPPTAGGATQDGSTRDGGALDGSTPVADASGASDAAPDSVSPAPDAATLPLTVTSAAFADGAFIPKVHSCDGAGQSIPLAWSEAPDGTQSYAVVMRDLSLPGPDNYHWVIWDIPAATTSLPQGIANQATPPTPAGSKQTAWSFGPQAGYGNVCPPPGTPHDYELAVYAFPVAALPQAAVSMGPNEVDALIQTHKTAAGTIVGKYARE
ncbi:MAG: hypothetical protein BGO98_19870 [Myxococcales bacterium 68-20]|nr:YbhB/YbcL family Raf kinase inhibitor-like protein [Myxococcales bacterium]OJY22546.1 MAG: hypothetical protein BGO98_19870 [Myxococcales bacterium 68-20]